MLEADYGKCPHCGAPAAHFGMAKAAIGNDAPGLGWPGVSIICMTCDKVVSVMVDPEHIISRISNEISSGLRHLGTQL